MPSRKKGRHGVLFAKAMSQSPQDWLHVWLVEETGILNKDCHSPSQVFISFAHFPVPSGCRKIEKAKPSPLSVDKCQAEENPPTPFYTKEKIWVGLLMVYPCSRVMMPQMGPRYAWKRKLKKAIQSVKNKDPMDKKMKTEKLAPKCFALQENLKLIIRSLKDTRQPN